MKALKAPRPTLTPLVRDDQGGYRSFCRDFFAFKQDVGAGVWLQPEAALYTSNANFVSVPMYPPSIAGSIQRLVVAAHAAHKILPTQKIAYQLI
jgi:hypothetical protein